MKRATPYHLEGIKYKLENCLLNLLAGVFSCVFKGKEPAYVEGERQRVESFSSTRPLAPESCLHLDRGYEVR